LQYINSTTRLLVPDYVNVICATEIRYQRIWFYLAKIAAVGLGFFVVLGMRRYINDVNRFSCILNG
jgi:hypothetical protein